MLMRCSSSCCLDFLPCSMSASADSKILGEGLMHHKLILMFWQSILCR